MDRREQYRAKFKDPRWQKKRLEIFERDEFRCQFCMDNGSTLNVHHRWYVDGADPWDYPGDCLVTLCEGCHESETIRLPEATRRLIQVLKMCGASSNAFELLVEPFEGASLAPSEGFDDWSVLTHGIRELLRSIGTEEWDALRARLYAWYSLKRESGLSDPTASGAGR
jgi:hypothetical protein